MVSEKLWDPKLSTEPLAVGYSTCKEIVNDIDIPVTGVIPSYVDGFLYRNGPGVYEVTHKSSGDVTHINHWFDGISVVHRFHISNNTVKYKNRRTMQDYIEAVESTPTKNSFKSIVFGDQDPCRGLLGTLFSFWKPALKHPETGKPVSNIGVTLERVPKVGPLVTRTDFNRSTALDIETLEPLNKLSFRDLNPELSGRASAAHGVTDPDTGAYFNYTYEYAPKAQYVVFESNNEETRVLARFQEVPVYIHSITATKKYVVLMTYSAPLSLLKLLTTSYADSMDTKSTMRVKFYVISREHAKISAVFDSDPFFCFHNINAFDEDGKVVIDLAKYDDASVTGMLYRSKILRGEAKLGAVPVRFTTPNMEEAAASYMDDGKPVASLAPVLLANDCDIELPRVCDTKCMRRYQYAYGISDAGMKAPAPLFNSLVKLHVETGEKQLYTPADGACGEPIFVKNPEGSEEDDGVLLSVVLDKREQKSFMAVVDARTMQEIARASVPQAVPLGFHGQYMSEGFVKSL